MPDEGALYRDRSSMTKAEEYRAALRRLGSDRDDYLGANSGLSGPRANLEVGTGGCGGSRFADAVAFCDRGAMSTWLFEVR